MDSNSEYTNKQKSNPWAVLLCRQIIIKDIQRARSRLVGFCSSWWGIKKKCFMGVSIRIFQPINDLSKGGINQTGAIGGRIMGGIH